MYRGFLPKAAELGGPERDYTPREVLLDAANGMRRISMATFAICAILLVAIFMSRSETVAEQWFSLVVTSVLLASAVANTAGAFLMERVRIAPKLVSGGTLVGFVIYAVFGVIYTVGGGLATDWFPGVASLALAALYGFGLSRLLRGDVRAYFWQQREQELDEGPGLQPEDDETEPDEIVLDVDRSERSTTASQQEREVVERGL